MIFGRQFDFIGRRERSVLAEQRTRTCLHAVAVRCLLLLPCAVSPCNQSFFQHKLLEQLRLVVVHEARMTWGRRSTLLVH